MSKRAKGEDGALVAPEASGVGEVAAGDAAVLRGNSEELFPELATFLEDVLAEGGAAAQQGATAELMTRSASDEIFTNFLKEQGVHEGSREGGGATERVLDYSNALAQVLSSSLATELEPLLRGPGADGKLPLAGRGQSASAVASAAAAAAVATAPPSLRQPEEAAAALNGVLARLKAHPVHGLAPGTDGGALVPPAQNTSLHSLLANAGHPVGISAKEADVGSTGDQAEKRAAALNSVQSVLQRLRGADSARLPSAKAASSVPSALAVGSSQQAMQLEGLLHRLRGEVPASANSQPAGDGVKGEQLPGAFSFGMLAAGSMPCMGANAHLPNSQLANAVRQAVMASGLREQSVLSSAMGNIVAPPRLTVATENGKSVTPTDERTSQPPSAREKRVARLAKRKTRSGTDDAGGEGGDTSSQVTALKKRVAELERDLRSTSMRLGFMNRINSEQTQRIEQLEEENKDLKERLGKTSS